MAKYRLKKDLPDLEAGAIFDLAENLDDDTSSMFDSTGTYRFDKDDIKHFDEWFEEVKESGWWKPKNDDRYYFVNDSGCIQSDTWQNNFWEVARYSMGNVFKTEEAAQAYTDYLKAIATVRQDEGVLTPEQINELERIAGDAYCVPFTGEQNKEVLRSGTIDFGVTCVPVGAILFDTEEHADTSCKKHHDEWKIIANYDWSRE